MRKRKDPNALVWPSWRYGPNGQSAIFNSPEEVPSGWTRKPGEEFIPAAAPVYHDREALFQELLAKGVTPLGHWSAAHMKELLK